MDAAPVLARGHNLAAFVPPVPTAAIPFLRAIPTRKTIVLTAGADRAAAFDGADLPGSRIIVSGLARAARRLAGGLPDLLITSAPDALALLERSALPLERVETVVLAWPEQLDLEGRAALEAVMAECPRDAQRIVLSAATGRDVDAYLERYAFKAMTYGFLSPEAPPPPAVGGARFVVAGRSRFDEARRQVLDALNAESDDAVVVAPCPESREAAVAIAQAGAAGAASPPVFVVEPWQLPWLRSLFDPLVPLPLPGATEPLERRADALRARLAQLIDGEDLDRELLVLGPLLGRYEGAHVAAAALRLGSVGGLGGTAPAQPPTAQGAAPAVPTWVKLWVGMGRKDHVRPGDLVGAIAGEAKVPADRIGRIEVRELYSLVDVRAEVAERVASALTGTTMRGRRIVARIDRGPGRKTDRRTAGRAD